MKLKAREEHRKVWIPVHGGFRVEVREMTRADLQRILRRHTKTVYNPRTGSREEETDNEAVERDEIRHYVSAWEGLTVGVIEEFAPLEVGSDEELDLPEPDEDGSIPLTDKIVWTNTDGQPCTLLEYLWFRAMPGDFAMLIRRTAREVEEVQKALEEAEKKRSSSSSETEKTPESPGPVSSAETGKAELRPVTDGTAANAKKRKAVATG